METQVSGGLCCGGMEQEPCSLYLGCGGGHLHWSFMVMSTRHVAQVLLVATCKPSVQGRSLRDTRVRLAVAVEEVCALQPPGLETVSRAPLEPGTVCPGGTRVRARWQELTSAKQLFKVQERR